MKRLALFGALLLVLAACGDDDSSSTAATTTTAPAPATTTTADAPGGGSTVTVQGFEFTPEDLTIAIGTTVTWVNEDGFDHTTTADDDTWDGALSGSGGTFTVTFDEVGTFDYHCKIHPSMTATVTVEG